MHQLIYIIELMFHRIKTTTVCLKLICSYCNNNNDNNNNNNDSDRIQSRSSRVFTISSLCLEPFPTRTLKWPGHIRVQITCNTSSAYHMPCSTKGQLSYLV